ncbi:MAG: hypothetical protein WC413_02070 [Candidatus Nanoarchaeia archaeon]
MSLIKLFEKKSYFTLSEKGEIDFVKDIDKYMRDNNITFLTHSEKTKIKYFEKEFREIDILLALNKQYNPSGITYIERKKEKNGMRELTYFTEKTKERDEKIPASLSSNTRWARLLEIIFKY